MTAAGPAPGSFGRSLDDVARRIEQRRREVEPTRALLVGVSGIDGSGKGFVSERLEALLVARGWHVALIGADPFQNPQRVRLRETDAARHFYDQVFRWLELFDEVVEPLVAKRGLDVTVDAMRTHVDEPYALGLRYADIDIVLLEGIFLFKRAYSHRFDVKVWIDCTFETALARALARNQEGLPPHAIVGDYRRIYHAAQRLHLERDAPRAHADILIANDPAIAGEARTLLTSPVHTGVA